jgi:hypothetical protein
MRYLIKAINYHYSFTGSRESSLLIAFETRFYSKFYWETYSLITFWYSLYSLLIYLSLTFLAFTTASMTRSIALIGRLLEDVPNFYWNSIFLLASSYFIAIHKTIINTITTNKVNKNAILVERRNAWTDLVTQVWQSLCRITTSLNIQIYFSLLSVFT